VKRFRARGDIRELRRLIMGDHHPLVLYVGDLLPEAGVTDLLCAFTMLARTDRKTRLLVIGEGGLRGRLERMIHAAGLAGRAAIVSQVSDMTLGAPYQTADLGGYAQSVRDCGYGRDSGRGLCCSIDRDKSWGLG